VSLFRETADVSVRPAVPGDDVAMTAIQVGAWRSSHAEVLGEDVLDALDTVRMREQWAAAISSPPGPGFGVLVACVGADVVGFAAVAPVPADPDAPLDAPGGELLALVCAGEAAPYAVEVVTV